jgi:large subunit ribosomal protein L5
MANEKKEKKQKDTPEGTKAKPEDKKAKAEDTKGKKSAKKEAEDYKEEKVPVRLHEFYKTDVVSVLSKKYGYKNVFQVPKLEKISINIGVGAATQDPKMIDGIVKDLESIVGQKVVVTKAKKSVSNFKLREDMKIGCKVTLRKARMYEFLDRFINVAIPRIRDFRGVPDKSFDGNGNYTIGVKEHVIFPEINIDNIGKLFGMDVTFVTTAESDDEARELLRAFGMPFIKREAANQ